MSLEVLRTLFKHLHVASRPADLKPTAHPAMLQIQANPEFFKHHPEAPTLGYTTEYTLGTGAFEISYLTDKQASITASFTRFPQDMRQAFELSAFALMHVMSHAKQPPLDVRGKDPLATSIIACTFRALWPDAAPTALSLLTKPVTMFHSTAPTRPTVQFPEELMDLKAQLQALPSPSVTPPPTVTTFSRFG